MADRDPVQSNAQIDRPEYDDKGLRWAKCLRCGMGWVEGRESVELIPGTGEWTVAGERGHTCPEPYPYETARLLAEFAASKEEFVVSQRTKARIKLGLERGA